METKNWNLWNNITFKTINYRRNFDLSIENDSIITEHDGYISETRMENDLPPLTIGEFGLSIWNIALARELRISLNEILNNHKAENTYEELLRMISQKEIDINKFGKIVFITNLVLRPDYRKRGITEEFTEYIFRDFFTKSDAVIALVKPLQDNPIDIDFFMNHNYVEVRHHIRKLHDVENIPAKQYYSIEDLFNKTDREMNEYKLFAVATKCGFKRLDNSHLFMLTPDTMFQRVKDKMAEVKKIESVL
jgi:hypothetical protein